MENFQSVALSSTTKRPALLEDQGEVEQYISDKTSISAKNDKQAKFEDGMSRLTSHRLIWHDSNQAVGLSLSQVTSIELKTSFFGSPRIAVYFESQEHIQISFKSGTHTVFFSTFQSILGTAAWKKKPAASVETQKKVDFDPSRAGISGILQAVEENKKRTNEVVEEAFTDLKQLMSRAADMVSLADRITKKLEKEGTAEENTLMKSYLLELGISSPVTRETSGSAYHQELSKQLCEFLEKILKKEGMMTLPDIYCLFNRARGTALISPDDLYRACCLFEDLKLPFTLRKLKSGVLLVQSDLYDSKATNSRILNYIQEKKTLTVMELAKIDHISVLIAKEHLLNADAEGVICRDETLEGVIYYENLFKTF